METNKVVKKFAVNPDLKAAFVKSAVSFMVSFAAGELANRGVDAYYSRRAQKNTEES